MDKDSQRTPRPDEPCLNGGEDSVTLVKNGPQLADAGFFFLAVLINE